MIDFLGILLGDDCFIGANEWFCEWWRHGLPAKLGTVSATWGFDGRKLCPGVWPADSAAAWTPSQGHSSGDRTQPSSRRTREGLGKTGALPYAPLPLAELSGSKLPNFSSSAFLHV